MSNPDDRRYTKSHEWALDEDGIVTVGITEHAVSELGDLVFIELPEVGASVTAGDAFGEIESVKAVSELNSPITGSVTEVNGALEEDLETLAGSPFGDGWIIKVKPSDRDELDGLLSAADYDGLTSG